MQPWPCTFVQAAALPSLPATYMLPPSPLLPQLTFMSARAGAFTARTQHCITLSVMRDGGVFQKFIESEYHENLCMDFKIALHQKHFIFKNVIFCSISTVLLYVGCVCFS